MIDKTQTMYFVTEDVQALRSTAAAVEDTWSTPGQPFRTKGGAIQFFVPDTAKLWPIPPEKADNR
jgi:hypothetical protein